GVDAAGKKHAQRHITQQSAGNGLLHELANVGLWVSCFLGPSRSTVGRLPVAFDLADTLSWGNTQPVASWYTMDAHDNGGRFLDRSKCQVAIHSLGVQSWRHQSRGQDGTNLAGK